MHVDRSLTVLQDVDRLLVRETLQADAVDTQDLISPLENSLLHGSSLEQSSQMKKNELQSGD